MARSPPSAPGTGYAEAAALTDSRTLSICDSDWSAWLEDLATLADGEDGTLTLTQEPYSDTITVTVDGAPWAAWSWDAASGTVQLDDLDLDGSVLEVVVDYVTHGECD